MLFISAYVLNAERLFIGYPLWQLYVLLATLTAGAAFVAYRLVRIIRVRHQVKLNRDANIAIGHELQRLAAGLGRAYHDVETPTGIIDHIIVGHHGAYAINVVVRSGGKNGSVRLQANDLIFTKGDKSESIVDLAANIASLEREFRRLLDHRVRVRSVIAVPGWEIVTQDGDEHLLVNERSLPMLRGWKNRSDYLMNDDVDALQTLLTSRCKLTVVGG